MRILLCAHEAPLEPFDGFRGPVATLVERLQGSHEVRVLAVRAPEQSPRASTLATLVDRPTSMISRVAGAVRAMSKGRPRGVDTAARLLAAPLRRELGSFRPDVVHVTSGRLAGLAPVVAAWPTVLAAFDAVHLNIAASAADASGIRARALRAEVERWKRFETEVWPGFDAVSVVSGEDAAALRALAPTIPVRVIPAGVDADRFAPDPSTPRTPGRVVFHGVMDYAPNVAAAVHLARNVFPLIRAERTDAELVLAGRSPAPEVVALGSLPGVSVTGAVAEIGPVLSSASVYICAMRSGTGVKNKLLEAAANGLACVASPLATRGLAPALVGTIAVDEDDRAIAADALRFLGDPALAKKAGRASRDAVISEHDWRAVVRAHEALYREVAECRMVASEGHT